MGRLCAKARVKASQLVRLPAGLSAKQAMAIGTAGFTAMLAVMALEERGLKPGTGEVLVTGAAGGVGSIATAVLASLGYDVAASTGRAELGDYLRGLGAETIVDRAELAKAPTRPLDAERWAGAIDAVGGLTLATVLTQLTMAQRSPRAALPAAANCRRRSFRSCCGVPICSASIP